MFKVKLRLQAKLIFLVELQGVFKHNI